MTRPIKAIQTRYAGCHFRSRLEARWAVFFDYLGVLWEYEPQGILTTARITNPWQDEHTGPETRPYLPDFWLPDHELWAEVKGALNHKEMIDLLNAAASLSSNDGAGCHDAGGNDLVILGPIPRPHYNGPLPVRLHMHEGSLLGTPWLGEQMIAHLPADSHDSNHYDVADDGGDIYCRPEFLTKGIPAPTIGFIQDAYTAARSARFEHGQNGTTR